MKTIKTITCHDVYNVGAGLQAYALVTYLSSQGYDAEILNYKPEYLSRHYRLNTVSNPKYDKPLIRQMYLLAKLPRRLRALRSRKKKEFDLFSRQYLPVTQKKFHSNEELCAASPFADAYIAGSDQIWNPLFKNGKDPAFYLDFVKRGKKIAYAASFAVEELPLEMEEEVRNRLSSFDAISVRESSGAGIIHQLGLSVVKVCDPVFLLSRQDWQQLIRDNVQDHQKYLFLYDFDDSDTIRMAAHQIAASQGLRILSYFPRNDVDGVDESGPLRFLRNMAKASVVISNSFHATAFSLIFHKEFYVVGRNEAINTRMQDLLAEFGLEDRYLTHAEDVMFAAPIDWTKVDRLLALQIQQSKLFLKKSLEI